MSRTRRLRSHLVISLLSPLIVALLAGVPRAGAAVVVRAAPISLTASDGAGLELVSLTAEAAIDDPLAFTELHLVFRNPENRVREGRFRITLPPGATISRFALRVGARWQEGEVVEQQAARIAYEDFLHHRQDPALLETAAGNEFSARVFPIAAAATKEIVVSYAQELVRADEPYRLPLRGLPQVGTLMVRAVSGEGETRFARRDFTPTSDFEVAHAVPGGRLGLRDENLVVARVVPLPDGAVAREQISDLHLLVDTSASRALGLHDEAVAVGRLLQALAAHGDPMVTVAAFDQRVVPLYAGRASRGAGVARRLDARGALGASDLGRALTSLAATIKPVVGHRARVLLVTDGVATAGETGANLLRSRVTALGSLGVRRLDVLAVGGLRDDVLLSRLVTAGLPEDGVVANADDGIPVLLRRLTHATRSGISVAVDGGGWVWPRVLDGVQPGDEVLVYADVPSGVPFRLRLGGVPANLVGRLAPAPRPLLQRAWVHARIDGILAQRDAVASKDRALAEALKSQAIALSIRNRVLCPFTSLLVLEAEQDYARFGIERRALADILTVGPEGVTLLHRTEIAAPPPAPARSHDEEALPAGAQVAAKQAVAAGGAQDKAKRSMATAERDEATPPRSAPAPGALAAMSPPPPAVSAPARRSFGDLQERDVESDAPPAAAPATGAFKEALDLIEAGRPRRALARARAWCARDPGDVLALVALGESWEALGDVSNAARAYGSIIDLFPGRADLRRFAGERLERLTGPAPLALAIDTYRKAVEQRPDHPAGYHLLGFALLKAGHPRAAFETLAAGVAQRYPAGRFLGVDRILREDLGLVAAAWTVIAPARGAEIRARLARAGGTVEDGRSLRFILNWETDANDVDFHIHDARGGHAFYSAPHLPSGGDLYADVTTGYGPECFTIRGRAVGRAAPYRLQAHYYSRGPMGYGMGKLQIIAHDGHGHLRFDERPFIIMQDGAFVDLGSVGAAPFGRGLQPSARAQSEAAASGDGPQIASSSGLVK